MQLLNSVTLEFKMNEYFLLTGDKFMSDNQDLFIVLVDPLQKRKKEFKTLKKQEMRTIFTKKNLTWLVFSMTWLMDFKDIAKRTVSDNISRDKVINIVKNRKYDGYHRGIASRVYNLFDKTSAGSGVNMHGNNKIKQIINYLKNYINQLLRIQRQHLGC